VNRASVPHGVQVLVRSRAGIRIPGAAVVATWPGAWGKRQEIEARTATDGAVFLADVPLDGSATVTVRPSASDASVGKTEEARVIDAELTVTIDAGLPLRVRCVDDLTGRPVPGAVIRGATLRPTVGEGMPEGDDWILALVGPDQQADVVFSVVAPRGFVAWEPMHHETAVGAWTRTLDVTYPLRHEADVRVSVLDHEGRPANGAEIEELTVAGVSVSSPEVEPVGPGVFRLRGVPFFRRAPLTIVALTRKPYARARGDGELPGDPAGQAEVRIRLPRPSLRQRGGSRTLGIAGGGRRVIRGLPPGRGTGSALIEVRRFDGSPASGVLVDIAGFTTRTDDAGTARFERLPVGEHDVVVRAHGLLPLSDWICVTAGRETQLLLREPDGGAIDVHVTDAYGDPLPFAAIQVRTPSKTPWVDERGGRQRVDPFTDHGGYRRVERVEAGRVSVRATWAGLTAERHVDVAAGRVAEVTLVLR